MRQTKNSFDKETLRKIGTGAMIAGGAAVLTYLSENISSQDFGEYTPLVVALISVLINTIREFHKGV